MQREISGVTWRHFDFTNPIRFLGCNSPRGSYRIRSARINVFAPTKANIPRNLDSPICRLCVSQGILAELKVDSNATKNLKLESKFGESIYREENAEKSALVAKIFSQRHVMVSFFLQAVVLEIRKLISPFLHEAMKKVLVFKSLNYSDACKSFLKFMVSAHWKICRK